MSHEEQMVGPLNRVEARSIYGDERQLLEQKKRALHTISTLERGLEDRRRELRQLDARIDIHIREILDERGVEHKGWDVDEKIMPDGGIMIIMRRDPPPPPPPTPVTAEDTQG